MDIFKIPPMEKDEYDRLIHDNYICRIAFRGDSFPYIAPFLYSFDGKYLYFLPTRYGRKIDYFHKDPHVSVEIEYYSDDFSAYKFVSLQGTLEEVIENDEKQRIRSEFISLIRERKLSSNVLAALGYMESDPLEIIIQEDRNMVWCLTDVKEIIALKNTQSLPANTDNK
ncbi:MAG: pyridoxamine 5'-phosphate oxidase family protein [Candidatus Pacebacteria bacterium]|nr:pyridoxamine 5'-phosphate oxidase family protein [Candidatus Paceibacterota bacterium]